LFRTDSDVWGDDSGIDFQSAGTGRVTYLLYYDEETQGRDLLHVGTSYSARGTKDDQVRFRSRPEIRIGSTDRNIPFFVDTGFIPANFYQLLNAEMLWVRGPFSVQSEWQLMPVSTLDRGAAYFHTWYVLGSVFLTGENRAYRKTTGVLERIVPFRDFLKRDGCGGFAVGPGAWELAFRVSHLDLNSGGVTGGRLTDLTFGVNWYLSPYVRMTANYVKAFVSPPGERSGTADIFGIRMGYEF
jgi:phosphate-selective porin OprO/OprP